MSEAQISAAELIRLRTRYEAGAIALRLGLAVAAQFDLLDALVPSAGADTAEAPLVDPADGEDAALFAALQATLAFAAAQGIAPERAGATYAEIHALRSANDAHPLNRLFRVHPDPTWGHLLVDLTLLAGLAELHESVAALMRALHPDGRPYPTVTLALAWLEQETNQAAALEDAETPTLSVGARRQITRDRVESLLCHSAAAELGLFELAGDAPWHSRTLGLGVGVWEALAGRSSRVAGFGLSAGVKSVPGLEAWLAEPQVRRAVHALSQGEPCVVALLGGTSDMRTTRLHALLGAANANAGLSVVESARSAPALANALRQAYRIGFLHGAVPGVEIAEEDATDAARLAPLGFRWELPCLISAATLRAVPDLGLPLLVLGLEPLPAVARRRAWSAMLPGLEEAAAVLAARYPVEPGEIRQVAQDLSLYQRVDHKALGLEDVTASLRARSGNQTRPGVTRSVPRADFRRLLVPEHARQNLEEAALRVHQQIRVLDDWGFAQGRAERRGTRLLFYGPPGTGKTLAAEAMAHAVGVDLLAVDISTLVSKWLGETEKNLAAVFDLAERARALLLFDEADALFGKRADANDARDRYANMETAYLLQRLERYEGVAVLTTNLRTSLDPAFTRRFEFIVEFPAPDAQTRRELYRLHLPPEAPLAADVNLDEVAAWYALSGAQIKNATLAAAFLAAAEGAALHQRHFLQAIAREYDKAGTAHPGFPPCTEPFRTINTEMTRASSADA